MKDFFEKNIKYVILAGAISLSSCSQGFSQKINEKNVSKSNLSIIVNNTFEKDIMQSAKKLGETECYKIRFSELQEFIITYKILRDSKKLELNSLKKSLTKEMISLDYFYFDKLFTYLQEKEKTYKTSRGIWKNLFECYQERKKKIESLEN